MTETILSSASILQTSNSKLITAKSKSNFSSAFYFLSPEKREAIRRVYAFFRVIDDVVDEEPNIDRQKELLSAWRGELIRMYEGLTIVPLLKELNESVVRFKIPQEYFLKLIEGCEMDLFKKRYETFDELYQYCYRVASMVGLVCMKIFEYNEPDADIVAIDLGLALQLTNIIRDVGCDLDKGRIYLPQEDLKKFGVTEDTLLQKTKTPQFLNLMQFEYDRAITYYQAGSSKFGKDKKGQLLAAKIMAQVYKKLLMKIKKQNFPTLSKRVRLNTFEKMRILIPLLIKLPSVHLNK